jgi:hypothetical protein
MRHAGGAAWYRCPHGRLRLRARFRCWKPIQAFRHSFQHHIFTTPISPAQRDFSCTDETTGADHFVVRPSASSRTRAPRRLQLESESKHLILKRILFPPRVGNTFLGLPSQRIVKVVCRRKPRQRLEDLFGCAFHLKVARREMLPSLR